MKQIALIIAVMAFSLIAAAQEGTYTGALKATIVPTKGPNLGPYSPTEDVAFVITKNADNTINVAIPGYTLSDTPVGKIVIGEYTVSNIAYDESKGAYFRDYTKDGITMDFTMVGQKKNYEITKTGDITLKIEGSKLTVTNNLCPGKMPVGDVAETFEGTASASGIGTATAEPGKTTATYNMSGMTVSPDARGIVIRGGKKYVNR